MTTREDVELFKKKRYSAIADVLVPAMKDRQFEVHCCDNGSEAAELALSLIHDGSTVSWGGSVTLEEIGIFDKLKARDLTLIDRATAKTPEERQELMRLALLSDYYLTSFNGIAIDGTVFNIDGNGNRVAAITYGPKNVIAVVGMNKVTKSLEGALQRSYDIAAQLNACRFNREETLFTEGDVTEDNMVKGRICNIVSQIAFCGTPGRIKVILVKEDLGF